MEISESEDIEPPKLNCENLILKNDTICHQIYQEINDIRKLLVETESKNIVFKYFVPY